MSRPPTLVLVHSPLVGPLTWQTTAKSLRREGVPVVAVSLAGAAGRPGYPALARAAAEQIDAERIGAAVLVAHSGAGALLPAVAEAARTEVRAAVFVDALLPHPGRSWFDTAPPPLAEHLRALARGGRLPPWHEWFPPGTVETLLPGDALRERFLRELPELPLDYFAEPAPETPGWAPPRAYVRLSEAYEPQAAECESEGLPVLRTEADHLAMLTRPELVAGLIVDAVRPLVEL